MQWIACDHPALAYWSPLPPQPDPVGYRLQRFPSSALECIQGQIGPMANVRSSSGCALVFTSDSPEILVHLRRLRHHQRAPCHLSLQWRLGKEPWHTIISSDLRLEEGDCTVWLPTGIPPGSQAECWLWLPLISTCLLAGISIDEHAHIQSQPLPSARWLALGDSLTQGFHVPCPHDHWVHQVSQARGLPVWNLGVGGLQIETDLYQWALYQEPWDLVTIALGSNHAWHERDADLKKIESRARRLLDAVMAAAPRRVVWILPPWKPCEEGLGPPEFYGVPLDRAAGQRAQAIRQHLAQVLDSYAPALEVVSDLLPHDHRLLPDGLHPGALGMRVQAQRFLQALWPSEQ